MIASNRFWKNRIIKYIVTFLGPVILSIINNMLGSWNWETVANFRVKVTALVFTALLYITFMSIYAWLDEYNKKIIKSHEQEKERRDKEMEEMSLKAVTFESIISSLAAIESSSASEISQLFKRTDDGKIIIVRENWNLERIAVLICREIYRVLRERSNNCSRFEISYFTLIKKNEVYRKKYRVTPYIKMIAQRNYENIAPSLYQEEISLAEGKKYHFKTLFILNKAKIDVLKDHKEISLAFKQHDSQSLESHNYQQYIGIPVYCDGSEMIGLLQIISYEKDAFGQTHEEILDFAIKNLLIYAKFLVFACKIEETVLKLLIGQASPA